MIPVSGEVQKLSGGFSILVPVCMRCGLLDEEEFFYGDVTQSGMPVGFLQSVGTRSVLGVLLSCLSVPDVVRMMGRWSSDSFLKYRRSVEVIAP
jgi:hypothetical protein